MRNIDDTKLIELIKTILKNNTGLEQSGDDFISKIDVDYRSREIDSKTLATIFDSDNPRDAFNDIIQEWTYDCDFSNDYTDIVSIVLQHLPANVTNDDIQAATDYVMEHCHFEFDPDDFNIEYRVNMMLDTGDANYDFACNNALNYFSNWEHELHEPSSMLWLAKQQGKEQLLASEMKRIYDGTTDGEYVEREKASDRFVESMLQELENNSCSCSGLVFLCQMKLFDLMDFKAKIKDKTNNTTFTIPKKTMCGLFDPFVGGGSVLEIELDKDVIVPYNMVYDAWIDTTKPHGFDIDETYGLCGECWDANIAI